jgi:uncharacterized protein (TIGR00290 family)
MSLALSWSSGKDAAWTLHLLGQQGVDVSVLVTTVVAEFDRVSMHGVRRRVVRQQAALVDLPLVEVVLPWPCSNEMYQFALSATLADLKEREGITGVAFGDLFLSDVRAYRERMLGPLGLKAEFPLWGIRTELLAERMIRAGVEAFIAVVDPKKLDRSIAGARWTKALIRGFPPSVDPCGENGEFHTVVSDGPMFASPMPIYGGEVVEREGFVYADFDIRPDLDG